MSDMTPPPAPPVPPMAPLMAPGTPGRPAPASDTSKLLAAIGYPIWIVALIAILIDPYKDEKFVKFHGFQALALGVGGWIVLVVIGFIPFVDLLSPLLWLALFVYQIIIAVKAYNGQYVEIPLVYGFVKQYIGD
jgi:uncharacterized membrane protein